MNTVFQVLFNPPRASVAMWIATPAFARVCFVSNCRWEVGDVSSNIGETVLSYQTMKYKFNYISLVKFINFRVWYDNNEDLSISNFLQCCLFQDIT